MKKKIILILLIILMVIGGVCLKNHFKPTISEPEKEPEPLVIEVPEDNFLEESEDDNGYVEFKDRISMDWDFVEHGFLLKIATYKGGNAEQRAYTILVTLNRVLDENYPNTITDVVLDELYNNEGLTSYDFEEIITDNETLAGMDLVIYDKLDNSNGSLEYINYQDVDRGE